MDSFANILPEKYCHFCFVEEYNDPVLKRKAGWFLFNHQSRNQTAFKSQNLEKVAFQLSILYVIQRCLHYKAVVLIVIVQNKRNIKMVFFI